MSSDPVATDSPDRSVKGFDSGRPAGVVIRRLKAVEEFHAAEEAQRVIWGISDDTEVVPTHLLVTAEKNGGLVLGAFPARGCGTRDQQGAMAGFLFGFLGQTADGRLKHCSHMMGVHPAWRGRGLAYALKCAQREHVLRQGLDLITWTYDPLESVNARLNLGKLGAICRTYVRNIYGEMQDSLNVGLPSDRFEVEWWLRSPRRGRSPCTRGRSEGTRARLAGGAEWRTLDEALECGARQVNRVVRGTAGLPAPGGWTPDLDADLLLVETPPNIQAIKRADMSLARAWRLETRAIFEACFAAGYTAVHFIFHATPDERRCFYVLQRGGDERP